jgi:anti-sigma-K factor RskA
MPQPLGAYQLWVVTAQAPVSAGLLTPDAQKRGDVQHTARHSQPVAMAVTIEPAGGVPAPTGARYLVGTVKAGAIS